MLWDSVIPLPHIYGARIKGVEVFCPLDPPPPYETVAGTSAGAGDQVQPTVTGGFLSLYLQNCPYSINYLCWTHYYILFFSKAVVSIVVFSISTSQLSDIWNIFSRFHSLVVETVVDVSTQPSASASLQRLPLERQIADLYKRKSSCCHYNSFLQYSTKTLRGGLRDCVWNCN